MNSICHMTNLYVSNFECVIWLCAYIYIKFEFKKIQFTCTKKISTNNDNNVGLYVGTTRLW